MSGTYNPLIVLASYLVAVFAAYVALSMTGRITASTGRAAKAWLVGGACTMGFGIWSMHFVGMLAFKLPVPQGYDLLITLYSLAIAIVASAYALWMVTRATLPTSQLLGGGTILGVGVAAMHYLGMAAMRMQPGIDYDPIWFTLSVVIAIAAAIAALWLFFRLRSERIAHLFALRVAAAGVMGLAIIGMHYTGMAAANFPPGSLCGAALNGGISPPLLAASVGISTFAILGMALVTTVLDRRLQERTAALVASLEKANTELTHLALHDGLTRLPNRVLLEDRLNQAIENARRAKRRFAVMFIDLDGFKGINDAYGHHVGDRLLLQLSSNLLESLRSEDTVARLGGDEFVVLTAIDAPEDAATIAHKLMQLASLPLEIDRNEIAVSASIGVAIYPEDGRRVQDLMANADAAMYAVKERGRNGYQLFEPDMNQGAHERIALTQDLRRAIQRNELYLDYQPKLVAPAGPITGVEALVRWRHPERGLIMPNDFISLAERSGLIIELGRWVLEEACRQLAEWRADGYQLGSIAVNLSPTQFRSDLLYHDVRSALTRHGLPPASLVLEITESMAMHDPESSLEILRKLSELGVSISIDDFGTGYSSLMYLKKLPASELKIDRGFVRDLTTDSDDAAIVSAIVALGRTLGLQVIAEGVETSEQQALLTSLGCTSLQGYLLGRPNDSATVRGGFQRQQAPRDDDRDADPDIALDGLVPSFS
ncbi:diguanylate cyclase/phosphodiesterase [Pseudoxanthomonas sp. GM95]|uniref:putative bifunctional diguanylate cyclase/phosphodiesterase n=1 Tax=Pseudoxanthomonas sp. GM95 TaxID=1881043 RepID=UPI0008D48F91|nr:EAL domain-containing protein [Pseudoxanthomonas sp. GM95]SEL85400.1 diguanylate cyclase/phosphodiesterase [Pseudoxanthomonas sp. GM95]